MYMSYICCHFRCYVCCNRWVSFAVGCCCFFLGGAGADAGAGGLSLIGLSCWLRYLWVEDGFLESFAMCRQALTAARFAERYRPERIE